MLSDEDRRWVERVALRAARDTVANSPTTGLMTQPSWVGGTVQVLCSPGEEASVMLDGDAAGGGTAIGAMNLTGQVLLVNARVLVLIRPSGGAVVDGVTGGNGGLGWHLLETKTLTAATAAFTFTPPTAGYTDLKFLMKASSDQAADQNVDLALNGDTTVGNYFRLTMLNVGGVYAGGAGGVSRIIAAVPAFAARESLNEITIAGYLSAVNNKQVFATVSSQGSLSQIGVEHLTWFGGSSTSPITTVAFTPAAGNFEAGNSVSMLGLAAA